MTEPRLTAVVLTYDGRHLLETALPSFAAQTYGPYRLLVVDNGSRDDTRAWLATHHPEAEVLALPQNIGVTAALNRGWQAARTEYVALFNNDVELDPGCLAELVAALDVHPEAGSAGAKLIDFHDRAVLDGAGDALRWGGQATRRGHGERAAGRYETPEPVFGACGGAAIYRRTALDEVGPFDERFFAYSEDIDWSLRAQVAGHRCRYVPSAVVFHMGRATMGRELSDFLAYHLWRNVVWMVAKGYPGWALVVHAPELVLRQAINLAAAVKARKLGVFLRAWRDALRAMPAVLRDRRRVQSARRATRSELAAVIRRGV